MKTQTPVTPDYSHLGPGKKPYVGSGLKAQEWIDALETNHPDIVRYLKAISVDGILSHPAARSLARKIDSGQITLPTLKLLYWHYRQNEVRPLPLLMLIREFDKCLTPGPKYGKQHLRDLIRFYSPLIHKDHGRISSGNEDREIEAWLNKHHRDVYHSQIDANWLQELKQIMRSKTPPLIGLIYKLNLASHHSFIKEVIDPNEVSKQVISSISPLGYLYLMEICNYDPSKFLDEFRFDPRPLSESIDKRHFESAVNEFGLLGFDFEGFLRTIKPHIEKCQEKWDRNDIIDSHFETFCSHFNSLGY